MHKIFLLLLLFVGHPFVSSSQKSVDQIIIDANEIYFSNPDSSYRLAKSIDIRNITPQQRADLALSISKYLILTTDYEEAAYQLERAIKYYSKKKQWNNLASSFRLKSIVAERIGEEGEARSLIAQAIKLNERTGNTSPLFSNLSNLTSAYLRISNADSALFYLNKLDSLTKKSNNPDHYFVNQNWGRYYMLIGDYEAALKHFNIALKTSEKQKMIDSKATCLMFIAQTYQYKGDLRNAEEFALMSYNYSTENNLIYEKSEALEVMLDIAKLKKDFVAAFKYQSELIEVNQEIFNLEKLNKVKQVKNVLDLAEKNKELSDEKALNAQKDLETNLAESRTNIFMLSLIGVLLILFLVGYAFVKNKKLYSIIKTQKTIDDEKNELIAVALKDLDDSLNYSKIIQNALLPAESEFEDSFTELFVFFKPKEKVSGDFYWHYKTNDNVFFCVADCTGHGVPGALVSVVGSNALNTCVKEQKLQEPSLILDKMSEIVTETLSGKDGTMRDGMDLSLCRLNLKTFELTYAGANNPIYIVNADGLSALKPNKQHVGFFENRTPFIQEKITLQKGDCIYLFSDGYPDQFGGPKGKKFMYNQFRSLLEKNSDRPMAEQKMELASAFDNWKGTSAQIDDVCVIGIRI